MPCEDDAPQWSERDMPDLSGYVVLVTGGNSGIGYATVQELAIRNARVYIGGRSKERVEKAIQELHATHHRELDLHFLQLDLQDLKSVKAAAARFAQQESRLDILINNAGIMSHPLQLTKDGYDIQWQSNYLAPWLLTRCLLPMLLTTAAQTRTRDRVRVVNVSSDMAFMFGPKRVMLEDVNMTDAHGVTVNAQRYSHSKQASIRHAKELNDRVSAQGVTAYSLHPGVLKTNLQGNDPTLWGKFTKVAMHVMTGMTPLEGAMNSLYCATSSEAPHKIAGKYIVPVCKLSDRAEKWLNDREGNAALWEWSDRVCKVI